MLACKLCPAGFLYRFFDILKEVDNLVPLEGALHSKGQSTFFLFLSNNPKQKPLMDHDAVFQLTKYIHLLKVRECSNHFCLLYFSMLGLGKPLENPLIPQVCLMGRLIFLCFCFVLEKEQK